MLQYVMSSMTLFWQPKPKALIALLSSRAAAAICSFLLLLFNCGFEVLRLSRHGSIHMGLPTYRLIKRGKINCVQHIRVLDSNLN